MNTIKAPAHFLDRMINNQTIRVVVIGAGGTGSSFLQKLLQMHTTLVRLGGAGFHVTVYDDDTVSETNLGRQAFYAVDLNQPKAKVLVERYRMFAGVNWNYNLERFNASKIGMFHADVYVTCVDNPETRVALGKQLRTHKLQHSCLWLDGGNDANSGQVILGCYPSDDSQDKRIPSVYDLFKDSLEHANYDPSDSCSHEDAIRKQDFGINDQISAQMIQLLWRLVRHGDATYHGVMIDMVHGEHTPMPVNPLSWQLMGFEVMQDAS